MKQIVRYFILVLFVSVIVLSPLSAQTVGYTYKALTVEGCNMKYSVVKQDSNYYIIATVRSERLNFLNESTLKVRTFCDEVFTLKGVLIGSGSNSAGIGIVSGNIIIPVTELKSTAQFAITEEQFEMLSHGVAKIRLSMTPMDHERTFRKDKIGKKLYQFYLKAKAKDDNF